MFGKFLLTNVAHTVFFFAFFQNINDAAATGFFIAVGVTADG